jgi:hypothetical protein
MGQFASEAMKSSSVGFIVGVIVGFVKRMLGEGSR